MLTHTNKWDQYQQDDMSVRLKLLAYFIGFVIGCAVPVLLLWLMNYFYNV